MTTAQACLKFVQEVPISITRSLVQQLRIGNMPSIPNPAYQARFDELLRSCDAVRISLPDMLEVAIAARVAMPTTELVWTGPSTMAVASRCTEQVLVELINSAEKRLTIMSFGIFQIARIVNALEQTIAKGVCLRIVIGDREKNGVQGILRQCHELGKVVGRSATLFQWSSERRLRDETGHLGLMHAKAAVADSRAAFLTSANLTEAALERNMELGVLIRGGDLPAQIDRLLDSLIESGEMRPFSIF